MRIAEFVPLIKALPVQWQSFRSKREIWNRFNHNAVLWPAIEKIFGNNDEVMLSRSDLRRFADGEDLVLFVMATIIWGYLRGMRGNHTQNLSNRMADLVVCLRDVRDNEIENWVEHYSRMDIQGVGLSTYTKFLHFLNAQVCGLTALILDDRLIRVANRKLFTELEPLSGLRAHNAAARYLDYLRCIHNVAQEREIDPAALELFLFAFGGNLKRPEDQQLDAGDMGNLCA